MSLYLNFEPHSHYMSWGIRDNRKSGHDQRNLERPLEAGEGYRWSAYTDDGNTYRIIERHADTLRELKQHIKNWHKAEAERDANNRARLLKTEEG